jgi:transcriptional regulator with XRE-family HTH domain/polyhydroxyalkanoate synthesis regulator phasin
MDFARNIMHRCVEIKILCILEAEARVNMILPLKQMRVGVQLKRVGVKPMDEGESLSQGELALRIGISQGQVSRYENAPETIPFDIAHAWCQACGLTIDDALRLSDPPEQVGIDPGNPYKELHGNLDLLKQYISQAPSIPPELPPLSLTPKDLNLRVNQWGQKPTLLITGRFDSGKTRIANALLGSDNLPSQYTPTTSVVTFVRHLSDRPHWQKEDVWIMKKGFVPAKWNDREHCEECRLIAGDYESLKRFGTKDGEGQEIGAQAALVYMNAPMLQACTLIDVPGFQDDVEDADMATSSVALADILLYTSPAKGFLDAADFLHLGQLLRFLPPIDSPDQTKRYGNFFLIATHADPSISDQQLQLILDKGSRRLYKQLGDTLFASSSHKLSETQLRQRMFTFWFEIMGRRREVGDQVIDALSLILPSAIKKRIDEEVKDIKAKTRATLRKQIDSFENALSEIEAARKNIDALRERVPEHRKKVKKNKAEFKAEIEKMRAATIQFIKGDLGGSIQTDSIDSFIRKHFKKEDKDDAGKDAVAKLLEDIQFRLGNSLEKESAKLKPLIDEYMSEYDVSLGSLKTPEFGGIEPIPFDAQGAFAGGLAAAGTLGALGLWASAMGNLGGYILVAKFASVLSIAGLGIGSSGLVSFVAAIGGPVTIAVGLAAVLAVGIWKWFGEDWQKRLAKQIGKKLQQEKLLEKIEVMGNTFWDNSWKAFELGATAIEEKFSEYLNTNEALLKDKNSHQKVEAAIAKLEDIRDFFGGIPWRLPG